VGDGVELVVSYILQASGGEQADSRTKSCDLYWGDFHFETRPDCSTTFTFFFSHSPTRCMPESYGKIGEDSLLPDCLLSVYH